MDLQQADLAFIIIVSTLLLLALAMFIFIFVQFYTRRQRINERERHQRELEFAGELLRSQLEISEEVMRKLSAELHDNIGQTIIGATIQMDSINGENYQQQADTASQILRRTLEDLREISKTLNGEYILEEGLQSAVEREVHLLRNSKKLECRLEGLSLERVFSSDVEIVLFRCIQECLSNIIKHARATAVEIKVEQENDAISISISDNGVGLPSDWEDRKGLGTLNMNKRIGMVGGEIFRESSAESGTCITLAVPMEKSAHV